MSGTTDESLERLRVIVSEMRSVLVAYSGGVDSALVLKIAHEQLGDRALACIGISPSYPSRERRAAVELAEQIGARYRVVEPHEHLDPSYAANADDRCYFCKSALFAALRVIAADEGLHAIADGTHLDDVGDHVHGMRAAADRAVRSPLLEAGLTKQRVRDIARGIGLRAWDKPATACLASRIPHGTPVTSALLRQIEAAEDVLYETGLRRFRVRHNGEVARIEVEPSEFDVLLAHRTQIVEGVRRAGYRFVTLDLAGFRGEAATRLPAPVRISVPAPAATSATGGR